MNCRLAYSRLRRAPVWIGIACLLLAQGIPTPTPPASLQSQLRPGESITTELKDAGDPDHFAIFGAYGDLISVGLFPTEGSHLQPILEIYGPDGSLVSSASGKDWALVSAFRLPSSGAYIVYVKTNDPNALGGYTLSVGAGWILRDLAGNPLKIGSPYSGALTRPADRQVWQLDLRAGAVFNVAAQPSKDSLIDPVIEVVTPAGEQLAAAHTFDARRATTTDWLTAPVTGTYLVRISAYANQTIGAYDLIVRTPPATPTPDLKITAEPINQQIKARVGQGAQYSLVLHGIPGQVVQIEARATQPGQFDPIIDLYGPSGRRVAEADDVTPDNPDAVLKVTLDDGVGLYTLKISGYALTAGDFILIVRSPA